MKSERSLASKLGRYMKVPIRFLCKARDLYVKSLTDCSGRMPYAAAIGCPAGVVYTLPKSFSVSSSRSSEDDDDLHVLIMQALSSKSKSESQKVGPASPPEATLPQATSRACSTGLPKSFSFGGIGRIDEDKPCDFAEDFKVDTDRVLYPKSKSYAVTKAR